MLMRFTGNHIAEKILLNKDKHQRLKLFSLAPKELVSLHINIE